MAGKTHMARRWPWIAVPALLVTGALAAWLIGTHGSPPLKAPAVLYSDGLQIPGLRITRASGDGSLDHGTTGVGDVFALSTPQPLDRTAVIRFDASGVPAKDRSRLLVAHRENPRQAWLLSPGRIVGSSLEYHTRHFSEHQLRLASPDLSAAASRASALIANVAGLRGSATCASDRPAPTLEIAVAPEESPLVEACVEAAPDGGYTLRLGNNLSVGLAVALPDGATVDGATGRGLSETVWRAIFSGIGDRRALLPGGGSMAITLSRLPGRVALAVNNSSITTDAFLDVIAPALGANAELAATVAQCVYESSDADQSSSSAVELASSLTDLWAGCGGALGPRAALGAAIFGGLKLGAGIADSIRSLLHSTGTVEVGLKGGGVILPPSAGFARRYEMRWLTADGEVSGFVELGKVEKMTDAVSAGFDASCFDGNVTRAALVRGRFDMTGQSDFDVYVAPQLSAQVFDLQRGFFDPDEVVARRLTTDDDAILNCSDGFSSFPWGAKNLSRGADFGTEYFSIIYPNVYGPDDPAGDRGRTQAAVLSLSPTGRGLIKGRGLATVDLLCMSGEGSFNDLIPVDHVDVASEARDFDVHIGSRTVHGCAADGTSR